MLSNMLSRIKRAYYYTQMMGLGKFTLVRLYSRISKRKLLSINMAGIPLSLRTATTDFNTAVTCLLFEEYAYLKHSNPAVIIDAGANIGASSIYFARRYPNAKVFAIEPELENFSLLQQNTQAYANIIPIHAALWSDQSTRMIHDAFTGAWGFTVCDAEKHVIPIGQHVECVSIDGLMQKYAIGAIDILKMDIEGSEKIVFEHAKNWIDYVNVITVELHDRVQMGCTRAFYLATENFSHFEVHGEKVTAYRT